jgi:hypothetical protein
MEKGTIIILVVILIIGLLINKTIQSRSIVCDNQISNLNQELIEINKLTKNLINETNIVTTNKYYETMLSTGKSICAGNELLFYGTIYTTEYQTVCYSKNNLQFKYFALNELLGVKNET